MVSRCMPARSAISVIEGSGSPARSLRWWLSRRPSNVCRAGICPVRGEPRDAIRVDVLSRWQFRLFIRKLKTPQGVRRSVARALQGLGGVENLKLHYCAHTSRCAYSRSTATAQSDLAAQMEPCPQNTRVAAHARPLA